MSGQHPQWGGVLGPGWKATKLLGTGNYGTVHLWEYHPPPSSPSSSTPPNLPPTTKIALKLTLTNDSDSDPYAEGEIMSTLSQAKSLHVVRSYGKRMRFGGELGIYIEYCAGGSLDELLEWREDEGLREEDGEVRELMEGDVWGLFVCLVTSLGVVGRGTENPDQNPALHGLWASEMAHNDLKPDNIFLVYRGPSHGHDRYPILKIGNFGCCTHELKNKPVGYYKPRECGHPAWRSPENVKDEAKNLKTAHKGTCSNIFQIGLIMRTLMYRDTDKPNRTKQRCTKFSNRELNGKWTIGFDLVDSPASWLEKSYSKALRELVAHCLMFEPLDRPDLVSLHKKTLNGLKVANDIAVKTKLFENGKNLPLRDFGGLYYDEGEIWIDKWK